MNISEIPNACLISERQAPGVGETIYVCTTQGKVYRVGLVLKVLRPDPDIRCHCFEIVWIKQFFLGNEADPDITNTKNVMKVSTITNMNYWCLDWSEENA